MFKILGKRLFLFIAMLFAFFVFTSVASAQFYYVSQTATNGYQIGVDSNNGTDKSTPFLTIGKALNASADGDTITLNDGTYDTRAGAFGGSSITITKALTINAETPLGATIKTLTTPNTTALVFIQPAATQTVTLGALILDAQGATNATARVISITDTAFTPTLILNGTKLLNSTNFGLHCSETDLNITSNNAILSISSATTGSLVGINCVTMTSGTIDVNGLTFDITANESSNIQGLAINSPTSGTPTVSVSGLTGAITNTKVAGYAIGALIRNIPNVVLENSNNLTINTINTSAGSIALKVSSTGRTADNGIIRNNTVIFNSPVGYAVQIGESGSGAGDNKSNNAAVYGNTVTGYECGGDSCVTTPHGIAIGPDTGGEIYNNTVSNFYVCILAAKMAGDTTIHNNVCRKPYGRQLYAKGSADTKFYNNVVIAEPGYSAGATASVGACLWAADYDVGGPASSNILFKNNICYSTANNPIFTRVYPASGYSTPSTATFSNNLYYTTGTLGTGGNAPFNYQSTFYDTYATWMASGNDSGSLNTDPVFINPASDYTLQYSSPAIDSGVSVSLTTDFTGTNNIYGTPDIGIYEYQPPKTIGTSIIDVGSGATIYADGKFRDTGATSGITANLSIQPSAGFGTGTYTSWMTVALNTWNTTTTYAKQWTETASGLSNTVHTVGDLQAGKYYTVTRDSGLSANITGNSSCANNTCLANGSGQIIFTYTGSYSTHTFNVDPVSSAPTPTNLAATVGSQTVNLTVDSFTNDTLGQAGYYFSRTGANSGWIQTNSWSDAGLTCGTSNTYSVKYRNAEGVETSPITITASTTLCGGAASSSGASINYIPVTPPVVQPTTPTATVTQPMTISEILAKIAALQAQIRVMQSELSGLSKNVFTINMGFGAIHSDVLLLQKWLNSNGFIVSQSGPGSPGKETRIFGIATKNALIKFQQANGIVPSIGRFGPATRGKINELINSK